MLHESISGIGNLASVRITTDNSSHASGSFTMEYIVLCSWRGG